MARFYTRLPDLASELVALKVDLIVTPGTVATRAAKQATGTGVRPADNKGKDMRIADCALLTAKVIEKGH